MLNVVLTEKTMVNISMSGRSCQTIGLVSTMTAKPAVWSVTNSVKKNTFVIFSDGYFFTNHAYTNHDKTYCNKLQQFMQKPSSFPSLCVFSKHNIMFEFFMHAAIKILTFRREKKMNAEKIIIFYFFIFKCEHFTNLLCSQLLFILKSTNIRLDGDLSLNHLFQRYNTLINLAMFWLVSKVKPIIKCLCQ